MSSTPMPKALQAHIDSDHFQQLVVGQIVPVLTERTVYALRAGPHSR